MRVRIFLCTLAAALAPASVLLASAPAQAQPQQYSRNAGPVINGFHAEGVRRLEQGAELHFELYGSPGGNATVRIDGARRNLYLTEVEPGQYSGSYTIGSHDRIRTESRVTADLRLGKQTASSRLRESLVRADRPQQGERRGELARHANNRQANETRYCTNCATVEAVNVVETRGEAGALGTVGGAVVGGLLGNQVGSGSGRTAASVAGAVGGALAGREIERRAKQGQRYEVVVRYSTNGATQTLAFDNDPGYRSGDRVRVNNGVLSRDQ